MLGAVQSLQDGQRATEPLSRLLRVSCVLRQKAIHPIQFGGDGVYRGKRAQINRRSREDVASFRVAAFCDETFGERKACRHSSGMLRAVRPLADRDGALQRGNGIFNFPSRA